MNLRLAYSLAPLGVASVAALIVAPRLGPVSWFEVPLLSVPLVALVALSYVAGAMLLPVFWLLERLGKGDWHFIVSIGALAGTTIAAVMFGSSEFWAICALAGALSGAIFSLAKARVYSVVSGIVVAAVLGMCGVALAPDRWLYPNKFRDADDAISRIEDFRNARGRLPATLLDIGRADDEQGPLFYNRWSEGRYIVSFTAPRYGFFGSLAYDSASRTWQGGD